MLHPVEGLRAGQWIFTRIGAEGFSDGIPPDIGGNVFDCFVGPQDVIVIASLPEAGSSRLAEFIGSLLFESIDKRN